MRDRIKRSLEAFYAFMDEPIYLGSRPILLLLLVPLVIGLMQPLWHIEMTAPQYPKGLSLHVFAHTLVGGHDGADIKEINILNHYIGMQKLERAMFTELDWLPFGFGALALLLVRVAALGNVRALVDLAVLVTYFGGFSLFRFVHKMHAYGHDLSPDAPIKVQPFMPAMWGHKQIGNFSTHAYPGTGAFLVGAFVTGILLVTIYHLVAGRLRARKALKAAAVAEASPAEE